MIASIFYIALVVHGAYTLNLRGPLFLSALMEDEYCPKVICKCWTSSTKVSGTGPYPASRYNSTRRKIPYHTMHPGHNAWDPSKLSCRYSTIKPILKMSNKGTASAHEYYKIQSIHRSDLNKLVTNLHRNCSIADSMNHVVLYSKLHITNPITTHISASGCQKNLYRTNRL